MIRRSLAPLLLALVFAFVCSDAARAAVYVPTKTADGADGACDADCSLRDAVVAANAHDGEDVILLHAGIYLLSVGGTENGAATGDLDVEGDLVVVGDGAATTTVDGNGAFRLFEVPATGSLELRDLTLRNGKGGGGGGGVLNHGSLTILRSMLLSNQALTGGGDAGYGGAVYSTGTGSALTIRDSTVNGNFAEAGGGGIAVGGHGTLANLTIDVNSSGPGSGGGLYVFSTAELVVNNTTVTANAAGGRGGGIFAEQAAFIGVAPVVTNTIIAGNSTNGTFPPGTGGNDPDCSGGLDSAYDLIGIGGGCGGPSAANHDLVGTGSSPIDAKLGQLAPAGGPTFTRPLLAGSPALDAGNPSGGDRACESTDQRGATRPGGPRCDIGAYEVSAECVSGGSILCMIANRFRVKAHWRTADGHAADAAGVQLTPDSGYFWFFGPDNVEVTVKVLDGCGVNDRYWVFSSGVTNVEVTLTVVDTATGATKTYTNPLNQVFRSILDTNAFACH